MAASQSGHLWHAVDSVLPPDSQILVLVEDETLRFAPAQLLAGDQAEVARCRYICVYAAGCEALLLTPVKESMQDYILARQGELKFKRDTDMQCKKVLDVEVYIYEVFDFLLKASKGDPRNVEIILGKVSPCLTHR